MADSPTIGLDLQATGANSGTWGVVTNANLSILDNRNGGSLAVNVAGSSNVTLSEANVENAFLRLTGVLGASIDLIFPATRGGVYLIQNDSTGAFNITAKPSGGTGVTVPQGAMTLVFVNLSLNTAYKIDVVSLSAANTFTAPQTIAITTAAAALTLSSTEAGASAASLDLYRNSASPATADVLWTMNWYGKDSAGNQQLYAQDRVDIVVATSTTEQGIRYWGVTTAGAATLELALTGAALYPVSNDGLALGTASASYSDFFLASGGVINWNNGTYTVTQSGSTLALSGNLTVAGSLSQSASTASFSAHKNGSSQVVGSTSATKITFGTEIYDVGSKFASSTWTPVAGTISIEARVGVSSGLTTGVGMGIFVYKNGAAFKNGTAVYDGLVGGSGNIIVQDQSNGTDTYEVYFQTGDSGYTVSGAATSTYFMGTMV